MGGRSRRAGVRSALRPGLGARGEHDELTGWPPALLAGDNPHAAQRVAAAAVHLGVAMGRRARRLVKQNLAIAGTVIAVLVTWDIAGHLPLLLIGVAGHPTVLVALNGLRAYRPGLWSGGRGWCLV